MLPAPRIGLRCSRLSRTIREAHFARSHPPTGIGDVWFGKQSAAEQRATSTARAAASEEVHHGILHEHCLRGAERFSCPSFCLGGKVSLEIGPELAGTLDDAPPNWQSFRLEG